MMDDKIINRIKIGHLLHNAIIRNITQITVTTIDYSIIMQVMMYDRVKIVKADTHKPTTEGDHRVDSLEVCSPTEGRHVMIKKDTELVNWLLYIQVIQRMTRDAGLAPMKHCVIRVSAGQPT